MFNRAKIKLTAVYSVLVLSVFWLLSGSVYLWMSRSLGQSYISQVKDLHLAVDPFSPLAQSNPVQRQIVTIAGSVALNRLLKILLTLNLLLPLLVPQVAWILVQQSFAPVEEAHRRQQRFVSDASHELRTPLSVLTGDIEVTLTKKRPPTQYQAVLTNSLSEIKRLTRLVENLLFFARENRHKESLHQLVDLTDIVSGVLLKFNQLAKTNKISLEFLPDSSPSLILGSPSLLEQLFYNLVVNAITYTPSGGTVTVKIKNRMKFLIITVSDTGVGIPPVDLPHIFERFYRVDQSRHGNRGYGLGLAICQSIITWHRGDVHVKSKIGQGTTFTLTFPR